MKCEPVMLHLLSSPYEVEAITMGDKECLLVTADIAGQVVELVHFCQPEIHHLPTFHLKNPSNYPVLAHVIAGNNPKLSFICVNDLDSVSVNFECPELAFEESLNRHIKLLNNAIGDPQWNQDELLREFKVNWGRLAKTIDLPLMCAAEVGQLQKITVFKPTIKEFMAAIAVVMKDGPGCGLNASYVGISDSSKDLNSEHYLKGVGQRNKVDGAAYVLPLESLAVAPESIGQLNTWYIDALSRIAVEYREEFDQNYAGYSAKLFWLIFNAPTPSGITWFGLKLTAKKRQPLPCQLSDMKYWKAESFMVDVFNKELLMPRSGANIGLDSKSVLLVGCGSVGSELAMKLGSAGLGKVRMYDPDTFSISNLYRHTLSKHAIGRVKSTALADELSIRFPWIDAKGFGDQLLNLRALSRELELFDLIIIAIGNPTHERLFHQSMTENNIKTPVINTWLEGYGIGGHAILDIPNSKGCLRCAYVENDTGVHGLASNLNFFEKDQNIVKNMAGCGDTFIPYGAISSTQTALIAADLAVKYLAGNINESKKVSWKGDATDTIEQGIKLTPRYHNFTQSLSVTPLYNCACRDCRGEPGASYQGSGLTVHVSKDVLDLLRRYRQLKPDVVESAGLLIGKYYGDGAIWIERMTTPKAGDIAKPAYFKLDDAAHQAELEQAFVESQQTYLGTWHTHPQAHPIASKLDKKDWRKHIKENKDRRLCFVIVGRESLAIFTGQVGKFKQLQLIK
jgi:integrative and conjugative element protein (TIGR02256 family)